MLSNGQPANETTFNNAFVSRTDDTSTVGILDLNNTDPDSGDEIENVQQELNALAAAVGRTPGHPIGEDYPWVNNDVGTSSDTIGERADDLTAKFNLTTGHAHSGAAGDGALVDASHLASVRLRGSFVRATDTSAITGSTSDVSSLMTGKTHSTGDTVKGVVVNSPNNRVIVRDPANGDDLKDALGNIIYGRITWVASVWTLSFFVDLAGTETAQALASQAVSWYYQELFNPIVDAPIYSELAVTPSDNATQDVVDASATQRGLINTSAQAFAGVKTFNDTTQSTDKDTGGVVLQGGLGVEKNINAGGNIAATGTVGGSNLSGTNTGDVTLGTLGTAPNLKGATLAGQVLTLQPADGTHAGLMDILAQTFAGVKTWAAGQILQAYLALNRGDTATAATIAQLSSATSFRKMTGSTATAIQGIAAGQDGQVITVYNGSSAVVTMKHQNASATAADRLKLPSAADIAIAVDSSASFIYESAQSRWVVYSGSSSAASGGGGGSALQWVEDANAPTPITENSDRVYSYQSGLAQALYALIKVPNTYVAGSPINLRTFWYGPDSSGSALINAVSTLIRAGTDVMTSTTNQRTTTNGAVTQSGATQNIPQALVLDISSSIGQINGVSVSAGDLIRVKLQRDTDTGASDLKVPVYGAEVTFS